ncbi:tyrosine-type recombinase/integrase [Chitinophaga deserti]|uniref:tyrosine-type recombinase/integrase n=1 Tax=Chitinophaga deserti TaxID=2164099 RepID=UPI000D6C6995|nr:tyrosine-type recombinase/integrase [Chitinophaga deserti]
MRLDAYLHRHCAASTAKAYLREITTYLSGYPGAAGADYGAVIGWLGVLRSRYGNASTLNRILSAVKLYYSWLVASGQRMDNPAGRIRLRDMRSRDIQLQDLLTAAELEVLVAAGGQKGRYTGLDERDRVLLSLLVYQALKPAEIAGLRVGDIDLESGTLRTAGTVTTNERVLALQAAQVLLFYGYLQVVRPRLLKGGATEGLLLGLRGQPMVADDIVKHVLRHYPASAQRIRQSVIASKLKAGEGLAAVQVFAGHKYPSSTERYRPSGEEALAAAVAAFHPMG